MDSNFPVVTSAVTIKNYMLNIGFASGEQKYFDMTPYLNKGLFLELKKPEIFNNFFIANDTLNWLGGDVDMAPATLYFKGVSTIPE